MNPYQDYIDSMEKARSENKSGVFFSMPVEDASGVADALEASGYFVDRDEAMIYGHTVGLYASFKKLVTI